MQNSNLPGAFETLRRKKLRNQKVAKKLKLLRKKLEIKKPKNFSKEHSKNAKLVNLQLTIELRKKMDAVPQKTNKND